jgi:MoxR-like ATPase
MKGFFMSNLLQIEIKLNSLFVEREEAVRVLMLGLLTGNNCLLLGPPGTAKSLLAKTFSSAIGGKFFSRLIDKFTTPDDIIGPISMEGYRHGKYERILAGKICEAEIVFLDEVFKASSAILNSLLGIVNEHEYHNNGGVVQCPIMCLIGASNEVPAPGGELDAFYDRFALKSYVDYVEDVKALLKVRRKITKLSPMMAVDEVSKLREQVGQVNIPDEIEGKFRDAKMALEDGGITMSDRMVIQALDCVAASALIDGRAEAELWDIDVLRHIAWKAPKERAIVEKVVRVMVDEDLESVIQARDVAKSAFDLAMKNKDPQGIADANAAIKEQIKSLNKAKPGSKRSREIVAKTLDEVQGLNKSLIACLLGESDGKES